MSKVMAMEECPSISDTTFGFAYLLSSVAHLYRKSWKRIDRSPACPRAQGSGHARYAVRTQSADVPLLPGGLPLWKEPAKRCGVRHSRICVVRTQSPDVTVCKIC